MLKGHHFFRTEDTLKIFSRFIDVGVTSKLVLNQIDRRLLNLVRPVIKEDSAELLTLIPSEVIGAETTFLELKSSKVNFI